MLRFEQKIRILYCLASLMVFTEINAREGSISYSISNIGVESKIYDVAAYGILPNGQDTGDKIAALAAKVSKSGGGIIQFKEGTYIIGSKFDTNQNPIGSIRLYSNVHYRGFVSSDLENKTVLKCNSSREDFYGIFCNADYKTENISFENLIFDLYVNHEGILKQNSSAYRAGIICNAAKNVVIRNCRFIGNLSFIETRIGNSSKFIREKKNEGDYLIDNWLIENNEFVFRIDAKLDYYDCTSVGIDGASVVFRNNSFSVKNTIEDFNYYPNCCLEINGRNIWVYDNLFKEYTNAIDICAMDDYTGGRNFHVFNNKFYSYRGIGCWTSDGKLMSDLFIYCNIFKPVADFNEFSKECNFGKRNTSSPASVVFVTNPIAEGGKYSNIKISNNVFDYSDNLKFRNSLDYRSWKAVPQHKTDERNGISYEDYYSIINLSGGWNVCSDITIENNTFISSVFNCIYLGGKGIVNSCLIKENYFIDCSLGKKHYIIGLYNRCFNIIILDNTIIDSSNNGESLNGGLYVSAKPGHYTNKRTVEFSNIIIQRNKLTVPSSMTNHFEYTNEVSLINKD